MANQNFLIDINTLDKANEILKKYGMDDKSVLRAFIKACVNQNQLLIEADDSNNTPPQDTVYVSFWDENKQWIPSFAKLCERAGYSRTAVIRNLFDLIVRTRRIPFM